MIKDAHCKLSVSKIKQKLKDFQGREMASKALSELHYEFLKTLFQNKISVEQAQKLLEQSKEQFIQNSEEIREL